MAQAGADNTAIDPVVEMARRMAGVLMRANTLQRSSIKLAEGGEARKALERAEATAWEELDALQGYILTLPCATLAGAAVQIMLASALSEVCRVSDDADALYPQIYRALRSAMKVVAEAAGLDMNEVGAGHFAPEWCDPFPVVNLAD